jgi:hypothetical protein
MRARWMLAVGLATASALLAEPGARAAAADEETPAPGKRPTGNPSDVRPPGDERPATSLAAPAPPTAPKPIGAPATKVFPRLRAPSLLHKNQFGIALMPGIGFRVIAPYDEKLSCGEQAKRVCTGLLPFFLDVQPSFGFAEHWDVIVDLRFGIMTDFTKSHELAVAPGVRYWVDNDAQTKFYATIQGVFDATAQHNTAVSGTDFGVRNANGFMFDVMRNLGIYLQFGETIAFVRWLRFEIDAGVGVQVRIP